MPASVQRKRAVPTCLVLALALLALAGTRAWAGPPFLTDDPIPTPYRHGEAYLFSAGSRGIDGTMLGSAPGVELNYSFWRDTFVHLIVPLTYSNPALGPSAYGPGDVELGFKWHMVHQTHDRPDIGIFPLVELPVGNQRRGLGSGQTQVFLPLWLQKDWGPWTSYGGGGYWVNPGTGNRNWWFTGIMLQRQISAKLYLGGEIFHTTAQTVGGSSATAFNLGGGYELGGPYQVLFSAGRNLTDVAANRFSYYLALYREF